SLLQPARRVPGRAEQLARLGHQAGEGRHVSTEAQRPWRQRALDLPGWLDAKQSEPVRILRVDRVQLFKDLQVQVGQGCAQQFHPGPFAAGSRLLVGTSELWCLWVWVIGGNRFVHVESAAMRGPGVAPTRGSRDSNLRTTDRRLLLTRKQPS